MPGHPLPPPQVRPVSGAAAPAVSVAACAVALILPGIASALTELAPAYGGCSTTAITQTINVGPLDPYQASIDAAQPGQRILLGAGTYGNGLRLYNLNATAGNCIVIEGPPDRSAILVGAPINGIRNVVQIRNSSYIVLRNLEIDGTGTTDLDGVKSDTTIVGPHAAAWSHHITLENLHIHDFDADQQQVGISTKAPAWNWVVRNNVIERVGTGIYFGNSDGTQPFVNGLIEFNLVRDTIGYNAQIKHQFAASRPAGAGFESLPATAQTVIRHNVFHKGANSSTGGNARPNLLVGAFPLTGPGADDDYVIAANFFHQNPTGNEGLFQGEGNVIFFGNVLYNSFGPGVRVQPQNGEVRRIALFHNTVLTAADGIAVSSSVNAGYPQRVVGNAVFASGSAIAGGTQASNIIDSFANADLYVANPSGVLTGASNRMDLHPLPGALSGAAIDASAIAAYVDATRDFDDRVRDGTRRGAYVDGGDGSGWMLSLALKTLAPAERVFANGFESGF